MQTGIKTIAKVRAARKRESFLRNDTPTATDSDNSTPSESSSDELHEREDAPEPETDELDESEDDRVVGRERYASSLYDPPAIEYLDPRPRAPVQPPAMPAADVVSSAEPSDELISAVENLVLSSIRMQETNQLPFLLRNLRRGFRARCSALGIATRRVPGDISLLVKYKSLSTGATAAYETEINDWLCPLCELHGRFDAKEMLASHLLWDHSEVTCQWAVVNSTVYGQSANFGCRLTYMTTQASNSWKLTLEIPDVPSDSA